MKATHLLTGILGLFPLLSACDKSAPQTGPVLPDTAKTELQVDITRADLETKSTIPWKEEEIHSVQAFVFNADGTLDISAQSASVPLGIKVVPDVGKTVYVLVNKDFQDHISREEDLTGGFSTLLEDNGDGNFVMSGLRKNLDLRTPVSILVPVERAAAKVSVESITNDFKDPALKEKTFIIKGIYLINCPAEDRPLTSGYLPDPARWLNRMRYERSPSCDIHLYDILSQTLRPGEEYRTVHSFYTYGNPTEEDTQDPAWSARKTRLVIEATLGGETCYYPVTLPSVKRNTHYIVRHLSITRKGSASPDDPMVTSNATFDLEVIPWEEQSLGDITF